MNSELFQRQLTRKDFLRLIAGAAASWSRLGGFTIGPSLPETTEDKQSRLYLTPMPVLSPLITQYREQSAERTDQQVAKDRAYQPSLPINTTFMYPWDRSPETNPLDLVDPNNQATRWNHWGDLGANSINSHYLPDIFGDGRFTPKYSLYDSGNKRIIEWQLMMLREAHLAVAAVSWWGKNHRTDNVLNYIISEEMNRKDTPNPRQRFFPILEQDYKGEMTDENVESSLEYLQKMYADQPAALKIDGKMPFFAYALEKNGPNKVIKISRVAKKLGLHYIAHVFDGYKEYEKLADDWIQYGPQRREHTEGTGHIISPGFFKADETNPRLPRDLVAFAEAAENMEENQIARIKGVISLDEWGEGTSILPGIRIAIINGIAVPDPSGERIGEEVNILKTTLPDMYQLAA